MPTPQNAQACAIKKRIVFCESPIVLAGFMQQPTSDAHSSTYLISAHFDGISYEDTIQSPNWLRKTTAPFNFTIKSRYSFKFLTISLSSI